MSWVMQQDKEDFNFVQLWIENQFEHWPQTKAHLIQTLFCIVLSVLPLLIVFREKYIKKPEIRYTVVWMQMT